MIRYLFVRALVAPPVALVAAMWQMDRNRLPFPHTGRDAALRASAGYLSRHPHVAAHLADDPIETEEAA